VQNIFSVSRYPHNLCRLREQSFPETRQKDDGRNWRHGFNEDRNAWDSEACEWFQRRSWLADLEESYEGHG